MPVNRKKYNIPENVPANSKEPKYKIPEDVPTNREESDPEYDYYCKTGDDYERERKEAEKNKQDNITTSQIIKDQYLQDDKKPGEFIGNNPKTHQDYCRMMYDNVLRFPDDKRAQAQLYLCQPSDKRDEFVKIADKLSPDDYKMLALDHLAKQKSNTAVASEEQNEEQNEKHSFAMMR